MICQCGAGSGWTQNGEAWVCVNCGNPSRGWLRAQGDEMLNFFRGGPLDGTAYETSALLNTPSVPITDYEYTSDTIVSKITGRTARVWVHKISIEEKTGKTVGTNNKKEGSTMASAENDLLDRRTGLKVSRSQLSAKSGLSQAKIARIEKGSDRTTDEEVAAYTGGLDALAAEAETVAPAGDPE